LPRPFYLGAHQVTQRQFQRIVGRNPSYFAAEGGGRERVAGIDTAHFPVEHVTWEDAAAFCEALSRRPSEKKRGHTYRLPTEAEWEYGCRGLMSTPTSFGASLSARQANFDGNYPFGQSEAGPYLERPAPVGSYPANVFGLHDMHGNVWEWCQDWYGGAVYRERNRVGPVGPATGQEKVQRGGSWYSYGWACRASERCRAFPNTANERTGFRVVLVVR
jgi:formylglycine-generating enzyme required for sulfatase activity